AYGGILMSRGLAKADSALQEQLAGSVMATMRDPVSVAGEEVRNASADRTYGHANKVMAPAQKRSGRRRKLSKLIRREMARLEKGTQSLHQRLQTCAHAADGVRAHLLDSGTQADVGPALSNIREDPGTVQKAILLELEAWNLIGSTAPEEMARLEEVGCLSKMQQFTYRNDPQDMAPLEDLGCLFKMQPFSLHADPQDMPPLLEEVGHLSKMQKHTER
ncbi:hypothetical protein CYMTET_9364, partial [Cymbomonas tetramitiformis]